MRDSRETKTLKVKVSSNRTDEIKLDQPTQASTHSSRNHKEKIPSIYKENTNIQVV